MLGEPDVAFWTGSDCVRLAGGGGDFVFPELEVGGLELPDRGAAAGLGEVEVAFRSAGDAHRVGAAAPGDIR